ncbi:MAG: hypothetical protein J6S14_11075 [Clostridia bacterium]|nr:hypothetical protein [Clostridia bacterium]
MKKNELKQKTDTVISQTQEALQTMYDALSQGQQKKIVKNEEVKALFDRYGVNYE